MWHVDATPVTSDNRFQQMEGPCFISPAKLGDVDKLHGRCYAECVGKRICELRPAGVAISSRVARQFFGRKGYEIEESFLAGLGGACPKSAAVV